MGDEVSLCKRRNDIRENREGLKAGENKRVRRGEHFVIGVKKRQSKKKGEAGDLEEVEMGKGLEETEERKGKERK